MTAQYRGKFGRPQAERLLWRAGFGPRPGEASRLAKKGLDGAVDSLLRPGSETFVGPKPKDDKGRNLAPLDAWGHDHLWWLDRMVRTGRPLHERMTLVWHDWFATSNRGVGSQRLMLKQNELFRREGLGEFDRLLLDVTKDPAMLLWLDGSNSKPTAPNENYARELMELFTLGANRGYTERDIREQSRALTGFRNDWKRGQGPTAFRYDPEYHDPGVKRVFGKKGRFDWKDACRLCVKHRKHPSFFVSKMWSYFIPTEPPGKTRRELERLYVRRGYAIRPVVEAILKHPDFYNGPRMVKPPVVYTAGLLRARGRGIDTGSYVWLGDLSGQRLFYPPNVAGWDDDRWLDTSKFRGRWSIVNRIARDDRLDTNEDTRPANPKKLVANALRFWGNPTISSRTHDSLLRFAKRALKDADSNWKKESYPILIENGLRQLVAVSPDYQTS